MTSYNLLSDKRLALGESPVWDAARQCLYAVDIDQRQIHRWDWRSREHAAWVLPQKVSCLAVTDRGTLLAALEDTIAEVNLEGDRAALRTVATIKHPAPFMRFNDGRCDRSGRLWVGTMCTDGSAGTAWGGLYCLDERGLTGPWVGELRTPNGLAVSPDGATLYLSDSHPSVQQVWRMGLQAGAGWPVLAPVASALRTRFPKTSRHRDGPHGCGRSAAHRGRPRPADPSRQVPSFAPAPCSKRATPAAVLACPMRCAASRRPRAEVGRQAAYP